MSESARQRKTDPVEQAWWAGKRDEAFAALMEGRTLKEIAERLGMLAQRCTGGEGTSTGGPGWRRTGSGDRNVTRRTCPRLIGPPWRRCERTSRKMLRRRWNICIGGEC